MPRRVALVACVKTKRASAAPAQDLYTSPLFKGMRRYAELNADAWFILSAEHGVLQPSKVIAPYERTLSSMPISERLVWAERVKQKLLQLLQPNDQVIVLAGNRYREHILPFLQNNGFTATVPMEGLKFGPQLRWLKEQINDVRPAR